eukprot:gene12436-biopygen15497
MLAGKLARHGGGIYVFLWGTRTPTMAAAAGGGRATLLGDSYRSIAEHDAYQRPCVGRARGALLLEGGTSGQNARAR